MKDAKHFGVIVVFLNDASLDILKGMFQPHQGRFLSHFDEFPQVLFADGIFWEALL